MAVIWNNTYEVAIFAIKAPFVYGMLPFWIFSMGAIKHTIIIPIKLSIKILLYSFVYLPFKPLLYLLNINEDLSLKELISHLRFFVTVLIHYVMVGVLFGIMIGCMTGINLRIISYLFTSKSTNKLENAPTKSNSMSHPLVAKSPGFLKGLTDQVVVGEQIPSLPRPNHTPQSLISATENNGLSRYESESPLNESSLIFEDDDGYNYTSYDGSNAGISGIMYNRIIDNDSGYESINDSIILEENEYQLGEDQDVTHNDVFSLNRNSRLDTLTTNITIPDNTSTNSSKD